MGVFEVAVFGSGEGTNGALAGLDRLRRQDRFTSSQV
jgi:hypothetical protein